MSEQSIPSESPDSIMEDFILYDKPCTDPVKLAAYYLYINEKIAEQRREREEAQDRADAEDAADDAAEEKMIQLRKNYNEAAARAEISKKEYEDSLEVEREIEREIAAFREEWGEDPVPNAMDASLLEVAQQQEDDA